MKISITPPRKFNLPLAFGFDKCHNGCARFLLRTGCVGGGRMVIGTVSEGVCKYLA